MNENYIGSDFDDFLAEEGLLEEAEAMALKRVLAYEINELMEAQQLSKTEMAHRMKTSRAALDRLLDPENRSVTLRTMDKAARSLGKRLRLSLV
jgi:antitoxin HicB